MKIGILTFHLAHNYGAVLQCYALQEVLKSMGNDVYVIDYQQPYMVNHFRPRRKFGLRSFIHTLLSHEDLSQYFYEARIPYIKALHFKKFRKKYLRLTDKCYGTDDIPKMDLYIVGSDQPWNPNLTGGPDMVYWGQFIRPKSSRLITYAMSGSVEAFEKVGWENIVQYSNNFNTISFREQELSDKIEKVTGRKCATVLDPTLLADDTLWNPMINHKWRKHKYVLLYHVGGPKDVITGMTKRAKNLAEENGMELIDASKYLYSPPDFVSLIKYAQYVVTASFHAMTFAIIFQIPFCVIQTGQASDVRFLKAKEQGANICKINSFPKDVNIKCFDRTKLSKILNESILYLKDNDKKN